MENTMNTHNIKTSLKTIRQKLDYIEGEIKAVEDQPDEKEKQKLEFESALNFIKAKVLKFGRMKNDDVLFIKEIQNQFSGRWGKNVMASLFEGIGREDKRFHHEKHGDTHYLVLRK